MSEDLTRLRYDHAVHADAIVDALVEHGIGLVFVCPGSRSTPLVMALERKRVCTHVVLDERTAAYAAVGSARMGVPAAVCTTSGTAVANLLPALCEADLDELGIVALTADRPRSAIDTGANQTLDQGPLLAGAVRVVLDLDAPSESLLAPKDVRQQLHHALAHLHGHDRGPVHINARFSKPLEPPVDYVSTPPPLPQPRSPVPTSLPWSSWWSGAQAGMVVCGALPSSARSSATRLINQLGWPALLDVSSGITDVDVPHMSASVVRSHPVRELLKPDLLLWLGGTTVEEAVFSWAKQHTSKRLQLRTGNRIRDPERLFHHSLVCDPSQLDHDAIAAPPSAMTTTMRILAARDAALYHHHDMTRLTEPAIAHAVSSSVAAGNILLLGNSMPVRDVGRYSAPASGSIVIGNRGLSGIDGTFGTALGAALASSQPVTVLVGDLTALHDMTGLFALTTAAQAIDTEALHIRDRDDVDDETKDRKRMREGRESRKKNNPGIRVVAENNDGGGIFSFLPIFMHHRSRDVFEKNFGTPHGTALSPMAEALGAKSCRIDDLPTLQRRLAVPIVPGVEFIEVVTDRGANVLNHQRLDEARDRGLASPQVVLLHGALGCAADWEEVQARWPSTTMAIELPGHGSRYLHAADHAEAVVDDLINRIESTGATDVVVVAYSLGARLALRLALRQPAWLRGLVLESVHPGLETEHEQQQRQQQDDDWANALVKDPHAAVSSFYQRPVFASFRSHADFDAKVANRIARAARQPATLSAMWTATSLGRQPSLWSSLPTITVPTLVITGALDLAYGVHGARIASLVPQAQHVVVDHAGHNVHLEQVDAYLRIVQQWWQSVPKRSS
jgi:2-succinyl-5-enolpyruvyl-6-hydroxy-3-cyclohexene-1-carboxylate synthase